MSIAEYGARPLAERLRLRDLVVRRLRGWFHERGYVEVETPQRVACPGIDVHLDAIPAGRRPPPRHLARAGDEEAPRRRVHAHLPGGARVPRRTSAASATRRSSRMLEWYAAGEDYRDLMAATEELVAAAAAALEGEGVRTRLGAWQRPFARLGVDEAFERFAGWRPSRAFDEERFFEDFVEKVEPRLAGLGAVYLQDWPAAAGALARRSPADPAVCERVELLLDGLEVCNGFSELTDPVEQRERFERDNAERLRRGKEAYPIDGAFLDALTSGIPPCAGNALGVDRLLMALTGSAPPRRRHAARRPLRRRPRAPAPPGAGWRRAATMGRMARAETTAAGGSCMGDAERATKVLVVFYSMYGHVRRMAEAVAEGAREVAGVEVALRRVPETLPEGCCRPWARSRRSARWPTSPSAPSRSWPRPTRSSSATPTRFGNMCGQMRQFLDATGRLWAQGALVGKVGSVFTSSATQHGGQESTILSLPHHAAAPRAW